MLLLGAGELRTLVWTGTQDFTVAAMRDNDEVILRGAHGTPRALRDRMRSSILFAWLLSVPACTVGTSLDRTQPAADGAPFAAVDADARAADPDAAPDASGVELALAYGLSLVGTPYGWWYDGPLPEEAPMWTAEGPPPPVEVVRGESANCTGLTNLMLRALGRPLPDSDEGGRGGTFSYHAALAAVAQPFDVTRDYPAGTLLGRAYRDTIDQGHVAVVLPDGHVLQSFAFERDGTTPGVNTTYTIAESDDGGFYEYAVLPASWLGEDGAP